MRPTLFEHAGGEPAFLALARAMNVRCVADAELSHAFGRHQHPEHDERLAAYRVEVLGGPPRYTEGYGGSQSAMVRMHSGEGLPPDWNDRFTACFVDAMDDAGLPDDVEFRTAMHAYLTWAGTDTNAHPESAADVPDGLVLPRWTWDGLVGG